MKKLLVMGLALAFVLTMGVSVLANPAYIDSHEYWTNDIRHLAVAEIDQNMNFTADSSNATIYQWGKNYAGIGQYGTDLTAVITQDAIESYVRISQGWDGIGNEAYVDQFGDTNRVRIRQRGEDNLINVNQNEDTYLNYARIYQQGSDNEINVEQFNGDRNNTLVIQDSAPTAAAFAEVLQGNGDDNTAVIFQNMTSGF